jgi:hypothetical protein
MDTRSLAHFAGFLTSSILLFVGFLQIAWGLSLTTWPLPDKRSLAETVVNVPVEQLPPGWTTVGLGTLIAAGGVVVLGRIGTFGRRLPRWPFTFGIWVVAAALLARGFNGLSESGLFVSSAPTGYAHWDAALYSPSCLLLGVMCVLIAISPSPRRSRSRLI